MAGANIPKQNSNEPSTVYAERVLAHIEQYAPEVNNLGRRVKAQVLNSLTNASIFTADSFRDRSKKD